jgi:hypothetical protein
MMGSARTSRPLLALALFAGMALAALNTGKASAQRVHPVFAPPQQRMAPPPAPRPGPQNHQEHLAQWMQSHGNLTPQQQQRALEQEPGFRQLPPQTQQRMRDRLSQLQSMNPQQRQRTLERAEQIEQLNPQQRQQVRGAMSQLGNLPLDRRRLVARAFRDLRAMPPAQREAYLHSGILESQFSPEERGTLTNLLSVEPLIPNQRPQAVPLAPPPPQ